MAIHCAMPAYWLASDWRCERAYPGHAGRRQGRLHAQGQGTHRRRARLAGGAQRAHYPRDRQLSPMRPARGSWSSAWVRGSMRRSSMRSSSTGGAQRLPDDEAPRVPAHAAAGARHQAPAAARSPRARAEQCQPSAPLPISTWRSARWRRRRAVQFGHADSAARLGSGGRQRRTFECRASRRHATASRCQRARPPDSRTPRARSHCRCATHPRLSTATVAAHLQYTSIQSEEQ